VHGFKLLATAMTVSAGCMCHLSELYSFLGHCHLRFGNLKLDLIIEGTLLILVSELGLVTNLQYV
jgi:hypothetical protein